MGFYKYTRNRYVSNCIQYGAYASKLEEVNDPYESDGIVYPNRFRICCLTTSPKQMLMWAYYTNHRGCCVEYSIPNDIENGLLKKVVYSEEYYNHRYLSEDEIEKNLFIKGKEWENENEFRAVWHESQHKEPWIRVNGDVFLHINVKTVTFGLLAEKDPQYLDALKSIQIHNSVAQKTINVKKMILSHSKYALVLDPQFDYEETIRALEGKA